MTQLRVVLDQHDIEVGLKEYCENALNMSFKGMLVKVEASADCQFPEEAVVVACRPTLQDSVAYQAVAPLTPVVDLDEDVPF